MNEAVHVYIYAQYRRWKQMDPSPGRLAVIYISSTPYILRMNNQLHKEPLNGKN